MPITPRVDDTPRQGEGKSDSNTPRPKTTTGGRKNRKSPTNKGGTSLRKKSTLTGLALINARFEKEQNLQRYTEEDFKRVFKHFDKDQNGHIDADELQEVLNELAGCTVRGTSSTACWGVSMVAPRFTFLSCFFCSFVCRTETKTPFRRSA